MFLLNAFCLFLGDDIFNYSLGLLFCLFQSAVWKSVPRFDSSISCCSNVVSSLDRKVSLLTKSDGFYSQCVGCPSFFTDFRFYCLSWSIKSSWWWQPPIFDNCYWPCHVKTRGFRSSVKLLVLILQLIAAICWFFLYILGTAPMIILNSDGSSNSNKSENWLF